MRVFVTGGTGTIGAPVVAELLAHGHGVLALARSDRSADALEHAGAEVLRGGLEDLDVLRTGAAQADGVVSLAFTPNYDSAEGLAAAIAEEAAAMAALGAAFAVTRLLVDFRRPARIDDALLVSTTIVAAGGARLRFTQAITRAGEGLCDAEVEAACIDLRGRARRPPPALAAALGPYLPPRPA